MRIEWYEDTAGGTGGTEKHLLWTLRGRAGGVVVEIHRSAAINSSVRYLETLRLQVLDGIRSGLGLPEGSVTETDSVDISAAMDALRRMAKEAGR